ncbi:hypothetical protein B6U99_02460 [Candidatus Geothermarchaeota archaeon ex4572_27]|nr:MAG: hypothetical protein B6U99_02460 [Candidatus Geothermarchaeota archaeon ex4572_27]
MTRVVEADVAVVGAGTAGATLAYLLASRGVDVVLIDQRRREEIGLKVCGDAIAAHHFREAGLPPPPRGVVLHSVRGIRIYPYDMSGHVTVESRDGGFIVDRHRYGQHLVNMAEGAGARILAGVRVLAPIVRDGFVAGVEGLDGSGEKVRVDAKVVADASGYCSVVLRRLPDEWGLERRIDDLDKIAAYREIVRIKEPFPDKGYLWIHFTDRYAPGGYVWIFPHSEDGLELNIGCGVQCGLGYPSPARLLAAYKERCREVSWLLRGCEVVHRGSWPIPNRRPRGVIAWNGFVAVGDAAIQIDPATAEGIGYGLYGASLAAKAIAEALEEGDWSARSLWRYAHAYMTSRYGVNQARFDVFRYLLQASGDDDKRFAIRHRILGGKELGRAREEGIRISPAAKVAKVATCLLRRRLRLVKRLMFTARMMRAVADHYRAYPRSPEGYRGWKAREEELFTAVRAVLKPYVPPAWRGS